MISQSDFQDNERWTKTNHLFIDLPGMEDGFLQTKKYRQEIWDYVLYRESLVKWPSVNEKIRMGMNHSNG
jgi:predicted GTPase